MAWEVKVTMKSTDNRETELDTSLQVMCTEFGGETITGSASSGWVLPALTYAIANKLAVGASMMGLLVHPINYVSE
jgi:hypothetical protein